MNPAFSAFQWHGGLLADHSTDPFPTRLYALVGQQTFTTQEGSTYFIYQFEGSSTIHGDAVHHLPKGYFASVVNGYTITGDSYAKTIIIERINFHGVFLLGGPIEAQGRLKYIDGCTDSLLIPPVKYGDACLNHLHFPPGIFQTMHTHPSIRVGIVIRGDGECVTPYGKIPLVPGTIFIIHTEGAHCFKTDTSTMDVIAYHPDSDFGPKDEEHPMINRTIVDGVSAKHIDAIRTQ